MSAFADHLFDTLAACGRMQAEDAKATTILDYAEPLNANYFKLRKKLGPYAAGEFVDRITLETLLSL